MVTTATLPVATLDVHLTIVLVVCVISLFLSNYQLKSTGEIPIMAALSSYGFYSSPLLSPAYLLLPTSHVLMSMHQCTLHSMQACE